jgi:putative hydrolase of the HAD superfamily
MKLNRPSVRDLIVELLASGQMLSVSELRFQLRSKYSISVSYQAIHKELQQLMDGEVVQRDGKLFSLKLQWLRRKAEFFRTAEENVVKRNVVTHISFDLHGTITPKTFDKVLWNEKIPLLYARKFNLSLEESYRRVYSEYYKALYVENVNNWTDIQMWFSRLGLTDFEALLSEVKGEITLYPDVLPCLNKLSKRFKLIIFTKTEAKFIDITLSAAKIKNHFSATVSTHSTFQMPKKRLEAYQLLLKKLSLKPEQIIHVGNDVHTDFEIPSALGIILHY